MRTDQKNPIYNKVANDAEVQLFLLMQLLFALSKELNDVWQALCISESYAISRRYLFNGNASTFSTFFGANLKEANSYL